MNEKKKGQGRIFASQSFTVEEVTMLDELLTTLRRNGDPKVLMRSEAGIGVMRKVGVMKASIERQKIAKVLGGTVPSDGHGGESVGGDN